MKKVSHAISELLKKHGYDNHVIVINKGEATVAELKPYGRVEITSHDGKAKQVSITENIRI